jgi:NAD(P)H-dependent FMN reductase
MWKVAIIISSTRPNRIGADIAHWVLSVISGTKDLEFELVDLAKWPLPDDEPGVPAIHEYVHEHTKAWSRQISSADGYIFVTPQYNWGYPASLKNAIDHLYKEWKGKPAVIISYGHHGGGKAAAQLRQVLDGLKMRPTTAMPGITFTNEMLTDAGRLKHPNVDFAQYAEGVRNATEELAEKLRKDPHSG